MYKKADNDLINNHITILQSSRDLQSSSTEVAATAAVGPVAVCRALGGDMGLGRRVGDIRSFSQISNLVWNASHFISH